MRRILVVDDEPNMPWLFRELFREDHIFSADSGDSALRVLAGNDIDLVMLDLRLPGKDGIRVLESMKNIAPDVPIIMMTAYGDVKTAVQAMKLGAHDYIAKPFDNEEVRLIVEGALRYTGLTREVSRLKQELQEKFHVRNIVTVSPKMLEIFPLIERISPTDASVMIQGESGTGKELVAKAIHYASGRKDKAFVPVNCAALPEQLLESELFGYEEGAFTGARTRKPGKLEAADGGTVLLDEVADLPPAVQPKILRVLEDKIIERLGSTRRFPVDIRIIAATNKDLWSQVEKGLFRNDLYFRLAVIPIVIPPLRERPEDVPVLTAYFLNELTRSREGRSQDGRSDFPREPPYITAEAMELMTSYDWPGNVRELKNVVQQLILLAGETRIEPKHLPLNIQKATRPTKAMPSFSGAKGQREEVSLKEETRELTGSHEAARIQEALRATGGNRTEAAKKLGISRRWLQVKIKRLRELGYDL